MALSLQDQDRLRAQSEQIADIIDEMMAVWHEAEGEEEAEGGDAQAILEIWDEIADERGWNPPAARKMGSALHVLCHSAVE
jgi:hypothetical protein